MKSCRLLLSVLLLATFLCAQTQPKPLRPESFEWDHQIRLWTDAYNHENYAEAEKFGRRSLEIVDQLGLGDLERATSLMSIAETLRPQKRYAEAEPLYRQALSIREKALPPIHVRTARALQGLGFTLAGLNRSAEAEPYYLRAIAIWDRVGEEEYESCRHGAALDGLGRVYLASREYEKAEPVLTRALAVWIKGQQKCGVIVTSVNDLAKLYWAQGKLDRCETMYRQIIPLLQQELGEEHPEIVADERARLAGVYMAEKKPADALPLLQQVVAALPRPGARTTDLLLQSLRNEVIVLRELHRDADVPAIQGQIDAIQGIQSQSSDSRTN